MVVHVTSQEVLLGNPGPSIELQKEEEDTQVSAFKPSSLTLPGNYKI